ncbi:N-6 DNA methylase [Proteinivorax hydrogeniformans]|uniref:site-specific DNA-methyltransferase (adenine-specific) n=1 Tax=Proteinivorax hydrogeniformans TaxID=1826727 RepID=A0AAU8HUY4_9FIRM
MDRKQEISKTFDYIYKKFCTRNLREATKNEPMPVALLFMFLKYVSDNKDRLGLEFEEKYEFDFLTLIYDKKISYRDLIEHIAKVERQLGFYNGILKKFAQSSDLSSFGDDIVEVLEEINLLNLKSEGKSRLVYDVVVEYFSAQSTKELRFPDESITNISLSKLIARVSDVNEGMTIYDFSVGYGTTLIEATRGHRCKLYAQDKDLASAAVAIMLMVMSENRDATVYCDDSIFNPLTLIEKDMTFDRVVAVPPFGIKIDSLDSNKAKELENSFIYGSNFKIRGDFIFARHLLVALKEGGIGSIIMPMGTLFRKGEEGKLRKKLLDDNYIDTVVELPEGIIQGTAIKVALVNFKKGRTDEDVFIVDLSKEKTKHYFEPDGRASKKIKDSALQDISKLILQKKEIKGIAKLVDKKEIYNNDTNLCAGVYMPPELEDLTVDNVEHLMEKNNKLYKELYRLDEEFRGVVEK